MRSCLRCGYDLRGLSAARCPECGLPFDPDGPPVADVPWLRRREIGFVRAYLATVFVVVMRPRKFAEQAWRWTHVSTRDGEMFRRITVVIAALAAMGVAVLPRAAILLREARGIGPGWRGVTGWSGGWRGLALDGVLAFTTALAFFAVATLRVPVKLRWAREGVEGRFAALQKYCCAGLALAPAVTLCTAALKASEDFRLGDLAIALCGSLLIVSGLAVLIAWCGGCAMYLMFAGRAGAIQTLRAVALSALLWALAAACAFIATFAMMALLELVGL